MSSQTLVFVLSQKAKSKGGDKYICSTDPNFNIYIPQTISRNNAEPHKELIISIGTS